MAASPSNRASFRTQILTRHLQTSPSTALSSPSPPSSDPLSSSPCLSYSPPELSESPPAFDTNQMRALLDAHDIRERDWVFNLILQSNLFNPRKIGHRTFVSPDYNQSMEQQREISLRRVEYLLHRGVYRGWLTGRDVESELRKSAVFEVISIFDHSLEIKLAAHFFLWYLIARRMRRGDGVPS